MNISEVQGLVETGVWCVGSQPLGIELFVCGGRKSAGAADCAAGATTLSSGRAAPSWVAERVGLALRLLTGTGNSGGQCLQQVLWHKGHS